MIHFRCSLSIAHVPSRTRGASFAERLLKADGNPVILFGLFDYDHVLQLEDIHLKASSSKAFSLFNRSAVIAPDGVQSRQTESVL